MHSTDSLIQGIEAGDTRSVARAITLLESEPTAGRQLAKSIAPKKISHVIGITGAPGSGKSTLVDHLVTVWRKSGKRVAVLAVDPSSPFSGGAVLGDRIRMNHAASDATVYLRSMATRGSLGGLAAAAGDAVHILGCAGFDIVLVETVGVGQAEVDILNIADSSVVVLVPGMGDTVQTLKAGLMEIADLFVVNKADRGDVDSLERDLFTLLSLAEWSATSWKPPVLRTVATSGTGADEVVAKLGLHGEWLRTSPEAGAHRARCVKNYLLKALGEYLASFVVQSLEKELAEAVDVVTNRKKSPGEMIERLGAAALAAIRAPLKK